MARQRLIQHHNPWLHAFSRQEAYQVHNEREVLMSQVREQLIDYLGGVCVGRGCFIRDMHQLHVDHRLGGGNYDRRRFDSSEELYRYYLNHLGEAKEKLQVLCANHHMKKHYGELQEQDWGDVLVKGVAGSTLTERFIYG